MNRDDFELFEGWDTEQVGNICVGCDLPANVNDLGLCARCNAKLDRDLIRARDWEYSPTAAFTAEDQREALRAKVIKEYGDSYELILPPGKALEKRAMNKRSRSRERNAGRNAPT